MEKLQMASNAIGDIDSLIQGATGDDEDDGEKFEDKLLALVLAALAGKDHQKSAELGCHAAAAGTGRVVDGLTGINSVLYLFSSCLLRGPSGGSRWQRQGRSACGSG